MNISTIGAIVRREREACGLTQAALAEMSHVSRVTIVNLENGKVGDIGAVKLSEIVENVGISLFSVEQKVDFIKMALGNVNTSYKNVMTQSNLEHLMLSGSVQPGLEGQVLHLIDETPVSLVSSAVKQIAEKKNIKAKLIWKNLAKVAAEIKSPNKLWSYVG
ncbi:MAG: helix-turn-helix transcriptional regulator [Sideroxydans sp.]|nr:helix-turn-helix transcriptional regulator [Sideroxydans sp.]